MSTSELGPISLYLFLALVVITLLMVPVILFVFMRDRSITRYDKSRREVQLSAMRETYEQQISELAKRLTATEDRWQELNHLIITSQRHQPDVPPDLDPGAIPLLREFNLTKADAAVDPKLVFVLTPFLEKEDRVFRSIRITCEGLGLKCIRGDETFVPGDVLPHIIRMILKSSLIIANVSGRNPNVFYELGIAHALGKTTIIVSETIDEIPFDIRAKRVVTYHNTFTLETRVRTAVAATLGIPEASQRAGKTSMLGGAQSPPS